jgi:hypothetical protein
LTFRLAYLENLLYRPVFVASLAGRSLDEMKTGL